jgi:dihydropyrimidine dehydrogenase (NAD+) subunit PreT
MRLHARRGGQVSFPLPRNVEKFADLHPALAPQSALAEANRCLFCYDAPCTAACPTHIDVPRFIKKISSGNIRGSALTILDANILGLSCSRVCPVDVLCEGACVLLQHEKKPIEIARLQRHAMEWFYDAPRVAPPRAEQIKGRVACVGGGPASIACAAELRRYGCDVTVFDNRPYPGGLNTYGVAEYKLRPSDSLREVEMARRMGVEFRREEVGGTLSLSELQSQYDFVFIGVGLGAMERLGIPGEDSLCVVDALRFIERYKTLPDFRVGRRVIVIGGGNKAIDAANAAKRLGSDEVHLFYRRTENEMPAFSFEYDHSKLEGVQFHWLAQPVEIVERDGEAAAVKFVETRLSEPDASGRRRPEPIPGTEFAVECDMVIPALGQTRLTGLLEACGIGVERGAIVVDRPTGRTSNPRFFAGGDCVNGGREVVDAVADGKRAAMAIVEALRG